MKRTITALAILIAATISIAGQSKDEQAIRQYFNELDAMLVTDEAGAVETLFADDLIFVGINGDKNNKADRINAAKNGTWSFVSVNAILKAFA